MWDTKLSAQTEQIPAIFSPFGTDITLSKHFLRFCKHSTRSRGAIRQVHTIPSAGCDKNTIEPLFESMDNPGWLDPAGTWHRNHLNRGWIVHVSTTSHINTEIRYRRCWKRRVSFAHPSLLFRQPFTLSFVDKYSRIHHSRHHPGNQTSFFYTNVERIL